MSEFKVGQKIVCINNFLLLGNTIAPPLVEGEVYEVKLVLFDSKDNPHLDVGLKSQHNFIRSFETKEELPMGNKIHWCHPSRFKLI